MFKKFCLTIFVVLFLNTSVVFADNNDAINVTCPGSATCCESGYNVMCHMIDPIKNYSVTDTVCRNRNGRYHKGVDLTTSGDGKIYAVFDGVVIATTNNNQNCAPAEGTLSCSPINCKSSRGISVTLKVTDARFAGYTVHYLHMSSKTVNVGDIVRQGDVVGVIGNTGCSTGRHLHFQINNYNGDAVVMNAYFLDKTAYACGGITEDTKYSDFVTVSELSSLLTNVNGYKYNAIINNCTGNIGQNFYQGIELQARNVSDVVNINAVQSGYYVDAASDTCVNGVGVLTLSGEVHLYCNLDSVKSYQIGQKINAGTNLGKMGISNFIKKMDFVVMRNGKYIDMSTDFLSLYGGKCQNNKRKNCSAVSDIYQNAFCARTFG